MPLHTPPIEPYSSPSLYLTNKPPLTVNVYFGNLNAMRTHPTLLNNGGGILIN